MWEGNGLKWRKEHYPLTLQSLDMGASIAQLGLPLNQPCGLYHHYEALQVYPMGNTGTNKQDFVPDYVHLTQELRDGFSDLATWKMTDTTPDGFLGVFKKKGNKPPLEVHNFLNTMKECYESILLAWTWTLN